MCNAGLIPSELRMVDGVALMKLQKVEMGDWLWMTKHLTVTPFFETISICLSNISVAHYQEMKTSLNVLLLGG
jgi:hypothetical protein